MVVDAQGRPRILDFGVARVFPAPGSEDAGTGRDLSALGALLRSLLEAPNPLDEPLARAALPLALRASAADRVQQPLGDWVAELEAL